MRRSPPRRGPRRSPRRSSTSTPWPTRVSRRAGRTRRPAPRRSPHGVRGRRGGVRQGAAGPAAETFFDNREAPYLAMVDLLASQGSLAEAFQWAERGRQRALAELLGTDGAAVVKGLTAEERDLERTIAKDLRTIAVKIRRERGRQKPDDARLAALQAEQASTQADRDALAAAPVRGAPGSPRDARPGRARRPRGGLRFSADPAPRWCPSWSARRGPGCSPSRRTPRQPVEIREGRRHRGEVGRPRAAGQPIPRGDCAQGRRASNLGGELYTLLLDPSRPRWRRRPGWSSFRTPSCGRCRSNRCRMRPAASWSRTRPSRTRRRSPPWRRRTPATTRRRTRRRSSRSASRCSERRPRNASHSSARRRRPRLRRRPTARSRTSPRCSGRRGARPMSATRPAPTSSPRASRRARLIHLAVPLVLTEAAPLYSLLAFTPTDAADAGNGPDRGGVADVVEPPRRTRGGLARRVRADVGRGRSAHRRSPGPSRRRLADARPRSLGGRRRPTPTSPSGSSARTWPRRRPPPLAPRASDSLQKAMKGILAQPETRHPFYWAGFMAIGR